MSYRVANRNGQPAHVNAPPRLRASQIERPFMAETRGPSLWDRFRAKYRKER